MKTWGFILLTSALSGLLLLSPAQAGMTPSGDFSLTLGVGYQVFEGNQNLEDGPAFSLALGYDFDQHWGAEGTFRIVDTETDSGPNIDAKVYSLQLDGLYHFRPLKRLKPYLAAGFGVCSTDFDPGGSDEDLLVNYGIGLKYFLNDSWALRGDLRHIIIINASDGDRTKDTFNNLATTAGLSVFFGDGDDALQAVGQVLESLRLPESLLDIVAASGNQPSDEDKDGVADISDQCPGTPRWGLVDEHGCQPGAGEPFYLPLSPNFEPGMYTVSDWPSQEALPVANFILKNPGREITIEVHTDNQGPAEYNRRFTQRQADSIHRYLVDNFNIPPHRIEAKGYGEERPISTNVNPEGREQNRRVVLFAAADPIAAQLLAREKKEDLMKKTASGKKDTGPLNDTVKNILLGY